MNEVLKAVWGIDYDMHTDSCYSVPACPVCKEPIFVYEDGNYHCASCFEIVEVDDPDMIKWFEERSETKTEYEDCPKFTTKDGRTIGCGGKGTVETYYRRNPVTKKWQVMGGKCSKCGMSFIV